MTGALPRLLDRKAPAVVRYPDPVRDLRHMSARAATDLADWLVHLELEGKADRTLYAYHRDLASSRDTTETT